jgi:hypothetical protein
MVACCAEHTPSLKGHKVDVQTTNELKVRNTPKYQASAVVRGISIDTTHKAVVGNSRLMFKPEYSYIPIAMDLLVERHG